MVHFDVPPEIAQAANDQAEELTPAEASQVYTVVKATLDKLALVGVINVDMQEQAMTLTRSVGEEIAVKIRLQRALEVEFQQLIEQQHQLRKQSNLIKKEENEANIKVVAAKLRASIEALCDKLKDNPNVAENMAKVASERQGLQGLLAKCLEELITMRRVPCVTEAVLAEHYRRKEIKEVSEREKTAGRAVATLRMELRDERDDHEQIVRDGRSGIASLKEQTSVQNKATHIDQAHASRELACGNACQERLQAQELEDLELEVDRLRKMAALERSAHAAVAAQLAQTQSEHAVQSAQWSARAQSDAQEKDRLLQETKTKHKQTLRVFMEMERDHAREAEFKAQREAVAQKQRDEGAAAAAQERFWSAAVTVIQAHWKGHKARQAVKGAKEKGKGKGKAKGKKKK